MERWRDHSNRWSLLVARLVSFASLFNQWRGGVITRIDENGGDCWGGSRAGRGSLEQGTISLTCRCLPFPSVPGSLASSRQHGALFAGISGPHLHQLQVRRARREGGAEEGMRSGRDKLDRNRNRIRGKMGSEILRT